MIDDKRFYNPLKSLEEIEFNQCTSESNLKNNAYILYNNCETQIMKYPYFLGKEKSKCDFVIDSNTISRVHAKIISNNEEYFLVDCESKNGTFLNGTMLSEKQEYVLHSGDIVRMADQDLKFLLK